MRLIDADTLDVYNDEDLISSLNTEQQNLVVDFIDAAPTIDAKPVVHAHWIEESKTDKLTTHCCSNCGGILSTYINAPLGTFCYKCGAKMDEEQ